MKQQLRRRRLTHPKMLRSIHRKKIILAVGSKVRGNSHRSQDFFLKYCRDRLGSSQSVIQVCLSEEYAVSVSDSMAVCATGKEFAESLTVAY